MLSVQKCVDCRGSAAAKPGTVEGICFRNPSNKTFVELADMDCTGRVGSTDPDRCITIHRTYSRNETLSSVER